MSGIAGVYVWDGQATESRTQDLLETLSYRGHDGSDHEVVGPVGLGYQHFATTPEAIDECQPIDRDGVWLVFDGRVDDRAGLVDALPDSRVPDRDTPTDAELVLSAYHHWGERAFGKVVGVFALALWDESAETLYLARGPSIARHLYYSTSGDAVRFGSDIATVLSDRGVSTTLNGSMVCEHLLREVDTGCETYYEDVQTVPPGTYVAVDNQVTVERFWQPGGIEAVADMDEDELLAELERRIAVAVSSRYRTLEEPRILLSGGLDSTTISAFADEFLPNRPVRAISMAFEDVSTVSGQARAQARAERERIEAVADAYNVDVEYVPLDNEWVLKDQLDYAYPSPALPRINPILRLNSRVYKQATEDTNVLITGTLGNIFDGNRHQHADLARYGRLLALTRELRTDDLPTAMLLKWYVFAPLFPGLSKKFLLGDDDLVDAPSWLADDAIEQYDLTNRPNYGSTAIDLDRSAMQLTYDLRWRGDKRFIMARGRSEALARGIELRHPFQDPRVIDFVFSMPLRTRYRNGEEKYLFRRLSASYLPSRVLDQANNWSFDMVIRRGLVQEERDTVVELLTDCQLARCGFVDQNGVDTLLKDYLADPDPRKRAAIWRIISAELWLQKRIFT